jgi:zinc/manganese transport system substrate-binding protein
VKKSVITFLAIAWGMALPSPSAAADLQIFACEPEWAALAREVGGDKVDAFSATHARQDPHHIRARPSLISKIRRADLVFCSGADLEVGWLPLLLRRGARSVVQPGTAGYLMAADHVPVLEKPAIVDRSLGDVHPGGNPHVHLDPRNLLTLADELAQRLIELDPLNSKYYRTRLGSFKKNWKAAMDRWSIRIRKLSGLQIFVHHKSFTYLNNWIGLNEVNTLEVKPGIPPTASHLNDLLKTALSSNVKVILRAPYDPVDASEWLSSKSGIPELVLPYTVKKAAAPGELSLMFDKTIALLEKVHAGS